MTNQLIQFERDLKVKGLSDRTVKTYLRCVTDYLKHYNYKIDPKSAKPIKVDKKLPDILSRYEIEQIFNVKSNLKHKTMLMITYSAGLRVSETASLMVKDIDSKRMAIKIRNAKGNKDRYSLLSQRTLDTLRQYWSLYRPDNWLFESWKKTNHISSSAIQRIFTDAKKKAGIKKAVSVHSLRHSFATHELNRATRFDSCFHSHIFLLLCLTNIPPYLLVY